MKTRIVQGLFVDAPQGVGMERFRGLFGSLSGVGGPAGARSAMGLANRRHEGRAVLTASSMKPAFGHQAGAVGHIPFATGCHVGNTGDTPVRFLQVFASDHDDDVSLARWMALTPHELVAANLNVAPALLDAPPMARQPKAPA